MIKIVIAMLVIALAPFCALAVDGQILINQSTVMAAGGFPYRITQTGSYKLSGNLTVPDANTTAILVTQDNVTIDLNGFSILGPTVCTGFPVTSCSPTSTNFNAGIGVDGQNNRHITVVNGSVRGMGSQGISLGPGGYVEKVHVESNGYVGIAFNVPNGIGVPTGGGTATGNVVMGNGTFGLSTQGPGVSMIGNIVMGNKSIGISVFCPSTLIGNTAVSNGSTNLSPIGSSCTLANNTAP